jgi:hypothetical protein
MKQIGQLIFDCIAHGRQVRDEANRLRSGFQKVGFSFDDKLEDLKPLIPTICE